MSEKDKPEAALLRILKQLAAAQVEQAARIDALEVLHGEAALRLGDDPGLYAVKLRTIAGTCHQKRLEDLEARNPRLAALLDQRGPLAPIDEALLRALDYRMPEDLPG
jgi:hypothetical protein